MEIEQINLVEQKRDCCGCTACYSICPRNAISMKADEEGFLYPEIDHNACIRCNACVNVCPLHKTIEHNTAKQIYAVKHKDDQVRLHSSSGGAFTLFSDFILKSGGVIYGAVFDEAFKVVHTRADDKQKRDKMRGSKYVQSFLSDTFKKVEYDLKQNKQVLFTGTPCQVGGLKSYLRKDYDNLFTVDIICHGVMSPLIFDETILCLKKIYGDFDSLSFRDKTIAWRGSHISINKNGKKISETRQLNSLKRLYYGHYATRPSCHDCKFTNVDRVSDITIGDFWGIENENAKFEDRLGISFVMVNSSKGERLLDNCKNDCHIITEKIENCKQPQLYTSSKPSSQREQFWADFNSKGYKYVYSKYAHATFVSSSIDKIKNIVKKTINKFR